MIRGFTSVLAGIIAGLSFIFFGLMITSSLYPYPVDLDYKNMASMSQFLKGLPDKAYVVKVIIHGLAAFAAGLVGSLVAVKSKRQTGIFAALAIYILILYRDFRFEYPTVYVMVDLCISAILAFFGVIIGGRRDN